jgi:hypothetical protein
MRVFPIKPLHRESLSNFLRSEMRFISAIPRIVIDQPPIVDLCPTQPTNGLFILFRIVPIRDISGVKCPDGNDRAGKYP